jgi:inorganic pyrophosphatase
MLLAALLACSPADRELAYDLPAFTPEGYLNMVVEIPAGSSLKIEYDPRQRRFLPDTLDGQPRKIAFLPYPGNYGFIPSTYMDPARGGDGDALDVLMLGPARPSGTVIEVIPVGTLLLRDGGEEDTKIIAVAREEGLNPMGMDEFRDLLTEFDPARRIVEEWFEHYKGFQQVELVGWEDEAYALREVKKWAKQ